MDRILRAAERLLKSRDGEPYYYAFLERLGITVFHNVIYEDSSLHTHVWSGSYEDWEEHKESSDVYDVISHDVILGRVIDTLV